MDKKRVLLTGIIGIFLVASIVLVVKTSSKAFIRVNPAFREYISGFTSGVVSTETTVKVRLTNDIADSSMFDKPAPSGLFSISPSVQGKAYWTDSRTLEFRPEKKLPYGKLFTVKFYLSKLMQVPDSMAVFMFQFQTTRQAMEVQIDNHKAYDKKNPTLEKISGTIITSDVANANDVQKVIAARQEGNNLNVTVQEVSGGKKFSFIIDSVRRGEKESIVTVNWNGKPIEATTKGSEELVIPSVNDFCMIGHSVFTEPEQYVLLRFSDPISEDQDLNGIIRLGAEENNKVAYTYEEAIASGTSEWEGLENAIRSGQSGLNFIIEDNEVKIYPRSEIIGSMLISVDASLKNNKGKELGKKFSDTVSFDDVKPSLRLIGEGVILPNSNGLIFPFEAVNLKAVDVKIMKVYENNVFQFLQVNSLSGQRELSRVGKIVLKKTIQLNALQDQVMNYAKWNRFYLDLADLIKTEPGAIYRVTLSAKKSYAMYGCDTEEDDQDQSLQGNFGDNTEEESSDWYYFNDYYDDEYYDDYDYYYYYDWYERDDPCSDSYYNSLKVSRNVLATDIGLIAKAGTNGSLTIFATNLVTAAPMPGVTIEIMDYQSQLLLRRETDGDGKITAEMKKAPYLIVARKGSQKSYLKLTGGSALMMSMFDVGGEAVKKGIKGFIYGERGVWRPGDSLFLTFILEDKQKVLPAEVPVVFSLINPRGQKVQQMVKTSSINGFYDFRTATEPSALTGSWTAQIRVGGNTFSKTIRIETIKPNRLKIKLDFGSQNLYAGRENSGTLEARWLHGAIARNLKADVTMVLNKATTSFDRYSSYVFDDPSKRFYSETFTVFSGTLNNEGKATILPVLNVQKAAPGMLKAHFETRVFEEGGEFSIDRFSVNYYPFESYVGLHSPTGEYNAEMLNTGSNQVFRVANLTAEGKVKPSNKIKVDVYKVSWRWWWDNSGDDLADFVRSAYNEPYNSFDLTTSGGMAQFTLNIPDEDWGRYFIRLTDTESGHSTGKVLYFDWPGWRNRQFGDKQAASMLVFTANKDKYSVGEEVKLTIPSSGGGRALISIETGSSVLQSHWIKTEDEQTSFSFTITPEMAPNVYAHVTLIQPHGQTVNDLPIRLYGVIPVFVDDPNTHLRPVITMQDVIRPEEKASITVKEENGKPMTYTIAVVDEGLLDLTRFKTPDPWKYFYAREALGVKTWDLYDLVMGAYGGKLERILSLGGDGEADGESGGKNRANRFKPMVRFFGPFEMKKGQQQTYSFIMPQYVGSVRVMVVAGQNGAYGAAEKTVAVRKPLMLLATLPRVLGPGETVSLPVSVFAMEKKIKNAAVKVTTNEFFTIEGQSMKSASFSEPGDELLTFNLKVNEGTGIGKVRIMANSGNEYAYYEIEIDIRNANPEVTEVTEGVIRPGQSWSPSYVPVGMKGSNYGSIEFYSIPPMNLQKRLKYLISYPYGCIEQTTSSVFPQLYLSDLMELTDKEKAKTEKNIKAGIKKIISFQTASGGLSYWPGYSEADEWATTYAGHFMLEAKEKGYTVSSSFLKKWGAYQKRRALAWTPEMMKIYYQFDHVQAYRLYTLALAGQPEIGAMNLLREQKNLSPQARWRLAAAYQLIGQTNAARQLASNTSLDVKPYRELYFTYGSELRDRALILEALSLLGMQEKAAPIAKKIAEELSKDAWMSTQTTAFCLLSIAKFAGTSVGEKIDVSYTINKSAGTRKTSSKPVLTVDMGLKGSTAKGKIKLTNNGKGILYAKVVLTGIPAAGDERSYENNLKISVSYKGMKGEKIDPARLPQGTDFIAEVSITNPGLMGYYYNLALSHIFPSGWEIHNTRMDDYSGRVQMSAFDYQDIRDDRVNTFFSLSNNTTKTYRVLLNASYLGRFYLPAVNCEAMYDNSIAARIAGQWVEVVPYDETLSASNR